MSVKNESFRSNNAVDTPLMIDTKDEFHNEKVEDKKVSPSCSTANFGVSADGHVVNFTCGESDSSLHKLQDRPLITVDSPKELTASIQTSLMTQNNDKLVNATSSTLADAKPVENDAQDRATWGGKIEFLLTCVGYAVGLGNVWRFPYLCYKHGGGAFLVPYWLMLAFVGLPMFFMEFAFGQFASLGPLTIWRISPLFKGIGMCMVLVSWILATYYNVIIAQCMFYLFASFTSQLPWQFCGNHWNNENCVEAANFINSTNTSAIFKSPSEQYYERFVLGITDGLDNMGSLQWRMLLILLFCWIIVLLALIKGIQSLGKVSYFTALFPYIMLTILLVRGATLPGSMEGIRFYLIPDFSRLKEPQVWVDAATQIFFSLSCCNGGLIAMSSYNKFKNNCQRDAVLVVMINCLTSVYAGFVIFSNLGFMAHTRKVDVSNVTKSGPGLAFVVYPEALTNMPVAPLWSVFFFIMMATLGFGSQFSIMETVLSAFTDEFVIRGWFKRDSRLHNYLMRCGFVAFTFLMGIPMVFGGGLYLLNLVDYGISGLTLLVAGLFEIIVVIYIYGYHQFADDIRLMLKGKRPNLYWKACWCFITPVLLIGLILFRIVSPPELKTGDYVYPPWARSLSWLVTFFPIVPIPIYAVYKLCKLGGWVIFRESIKPHMTWGPQKDDNKQEFYEVIASKRDLVDEGESFFGSKVNIASKMAQEAIKQENKISFSGGLHQSGSFTFDPNIVRNHVESSAALNALDNYAATNVVSSVPAVPVPMFSQSK